MHFRKNEVPQRENKKGKRRENKNIINMKTNQQGKVQCNINFARLQGQIYNTNL